MKELPFSEFLKIIENEDLQVLYERDLVDIAEEYVCTCDKMSEDKATANSEEKVIANSEESADPKDQKK